MPATALHLWPATRTCHSSRVDSPIRFHVKPELDRPWLLLAFEGWNDAGEAGTVALRYIAAATRAVPLADLDPDAFYDFTVRRPVVTVGHDGERRVDWPTNEFRYGALPDGREIVIGIGVEPHFGWRRYCDAVVDLALDMGVQQVALVGGYLADVVYSQPVALTGLATDASDLEMLGASTSRYEGPIGILGVLDDRLRREGLSVISLWAGLPHYIDASPNPRGALALVEALSRLLALDVDTESMWVEAAEFEERVSKVVAADAELADYVRRLKKREFAS